jgi:hypothetical protein
VIVRVLVVAAVLLVVAPAAAAADRVGYVDEIVVFGGPDAAAARDLVDSALQQAGLRARFAGADTSPCGEDVACLAARARAIGAPIALRVTVAEVAGEFVASVLIVNVGRHSTERHVEQGGELSALDAGLAAALAHASPEPAPRRRAVAWTLAGTAAALLVGGALATWKAHDLRDEFFAQHVDANGDIVGISPSDARAAERRARGWSIVGGLLLAGAAGTGIAATVLFVRDREGEPRPAGLAIGGTF